MAIGEKVRLFREQRGLSQDELGERLHRTGATISRYESGHMRIVADELPKFAEALGCSPGDFFETTAPAVILSRRSTELERTASLVTDAGQEVERTLVTRLRALRDELDALIDEQESA